MRFQISYLVLALSLPAQAPTPTATRSPSPTPAPTRTAPAPSATPTLVSLQPGTEITFDETGSRPLRGTAYGDGQTAILLANMSIGGQKQWDPFVAAVDKSTFTTVTFDYRDMNDPGADIELVLGWLREQGFARVVCIGASMGSRACSSILRQPEIVGVALIAGSVHHASVAQATYPKLFVAGAQDVWAFDIQQGYEKAAEPKELLLFENQRAHGTDLFRSSDSEQFLRALIEFVNSLAT